MARPRSRRRAAPYTSMRRNLLQKIYLALHRRTFARRLARQRRFSGLRVVSVGNLSAGGTGKTPATALLAREALRRGARPLILLRGYRGSASREGRLVSDGTGVLASAAAAGDEAVLLADAVPGARVAVGRNRVAALEAFGGACDLVLLDDAFQNPSVYRDFDLVLIDLSVPLDRLRLLPTGRFREDFAALDRADAVLFTRGDQVDAERRAAYEAAVRAGRAELPVFVAAHRPTALRAAFAETGITGTGRGSVRPNRPSESPSNRPSDRSSVSPASLAAFCGLGNPAAFRATLVQASHAPREFRAFPDHYAYRREDLEQLFAGNDWFWATTEKDLARLRDLDLPAELRARILVLGIEMEILDGRQGEFLDLVLGARAK